MNNTHSNGGSGGTSAKQSTKPIPAKARELLGDQFKGLPVWIRSPKGGPEHFCGFSRSKLYDLDQRGLIRSVSIREPGQVKGTRLFHLQSILAYIESCERGTMKEATVINPE